METTLATCRTRTGTPLAVRKVVGPDPEWAGRIMPFLGHKGQLWQWQLDQFLKSSADGLTGTCYLADAAPPGSPPQLVGNICTFESQSVGLFGHVFTLPAYRGQSVARILTQTCIDDFRARGGVALWLVTGFDSTPYRVYQQFGFESILPGDGIMRWLAPGGQAELDRRFAPGQPTHIRDVTWPDYATFNALSCSPAGPPHRSSNLRVIGQNIVEQSFLELRRAMEGCPQIQARVLATAADWPVGWAILKPAVVRSTASSYVPYQEPNPPLMLDLYTHPSFEADYPRLLESLPLPTGRKVIAIVDSHCPARQAALERAGFVVEGRLTRMFQWQGKPTDVIHLARNPS